jgi:hypothetical protein
MAFRIGGGKPPAPPVEEEAPVPQEEAPVAEEPLMEDDFGEEPPMEGSGEVNPLIAGYKGPEDGPFQCGNCVFYGRHGEGSCAIVAGPIDEGGLCNLFTSAAGLAGETPEEEIPVEEGMPEAGVEEPEIGSEEMA